MPECLSLRHELQVVLMVLMLVVLMWLWDNKFPGSCFEGLGSNIILYCYVHLYLLVTCTLTVSVVTAVSRNAVQNLIRKKEKT